MVPVVTSMWPKKTARRHRRPYKQPERALHAHVGIMLAHLRPRCVYFPVPNGAADLGPKTGALLKSQYKIHPGVSDWIFMWSAPCGPTTLDFSYATCGAIELKDERGKQNDDQVKFEKWCGENGVPYRVARSVDEVVKILEEWGRLPAGTHKRIRGLE